MKIALIGGTGVYDAQLFSDTKQDTIVTMYGDAHVISGRYGQHEVFFLNRHGGGHKLPPHMINYRANIWALKRLGVDMIVATAAVGSLKPEVAPGALVVLDQFLDFTHGRTGTFFDGGETGVMHVDMTEPYCPNVRQLLLNCLAAENILSMDAGTYVCTQGPRFETPAEIAMYARLGGAVVGMTNVPEVVLAREAEICYGTVAVVTNYAAGISQTALTHQEVLDVMEANQGKLRRLLRAVLDQVGKPKPVSCSCAAAVSSQAALTGGHNDG